MQNAYRNGKQYKVNDAIFRYRMAVNDYESLFDRTCREMDRIRPTYELGKSYVYLLASFALCAAIHLPLWVWRADVQYFWLFLRNSLLLGLAMGLFAEIVEILDTRRFFAEYTKVLGSFKEESCLLLHTMERITTKYAMAAAPEWNVNAASGNYYERLMGNYKNFMEHEQEILNNCEANITKARLEQKEDKRLRKLQIVFFALFLGLIVLLCKDMPNTYLINTIVDALLMLLLMALLAAHLVTILWEDSYSYQIDVLEEYYDDALREIGWLNGELASLELSYLFVSRKARSKRDIAGFTVVEEESK